MFKSNDELLYATKNLIITLDDKGCKVAAQKLRNGMGSLNGLTDGWGLFLESIELVQNEHESDFEKNEMLLLINIHTAVYHVVYRRKFKPWWKFW